VSDRGWIVIPNWDGPTGFQHYKDRTPVWIKNYTELMSDDAYLGLTLHQRGVLHGLWLEYARARRQIPDSTLTVSQRLGDRVSRATLDALNHAGFIEYSASKPLALRYQDASLEVEKRRTPPPPSASRKNGTSPRQRGTNPRATDTPPAEQHPCPHCPLIAASARALADHIDVIHDFDVKPVTATTDPELGW
jgi:hypothetical protein